MIKNKFKVPKKPWDKWSLKAKDIFNKTYSFFVMNQELTKHPKTVKLPPDQWKTISWNASWIAADACDNTMPSDIEFENNIYQVKC